MGVEYETYTGNDGNGFVVCLIPESSYKPHRAEFADKQYYYRAGDDFLPAEPGLLRILFHPRFNPRFEIELVVKYEITAKPNNVVVGKVHASYLLHNTGTATARDVFVMIRHNQGTELRHRLANNWKNVGNPTADFAFECKSPVHPGSVAHLFNVDRETQVWSKSGSIHQKDLIPRFSNIEIGFTILAENYAESGIVTSVDCSELEPGGLTLSKRFIPVDSERRPLS